MGKKAINSFHAPFSQTAVKKMMSLIRRLPEESPDLALKTLKEIKATINALQETLIAASKQAKFNTDLCEKRLEQYEKELNKADTEITLLEQHDRELSAQLTDVKKDKELTEKDINTINLKLISLDKDLKRLQDRARSIHKNCWIPGYGLFLSLQSLIEQDSAHYTQARDEFIRYKENMASDMDQMRALKKSVELIRRQLKSHDDRKKILEKSKRRIQSQRLASKKGVTLSSLAALCNETMAQKLETIETRTEDAKSLLEYIKSETLLKHEDTGNGAVEVEQALIEFGEYADSIPFVIKFPKISFPTIPGGLRRPEESDSSPTSPAIAWRGATFWPFSYLDGRLETAVLAFSPSNKLVKRWDYKGAKNITNIFIGIPGDDVRFVGQGDKTIIMPWADLCSIQGKSA